MCPVKFSENKKEVCIEMKKRIISMVCLVLCMAVFFSTTVFANTSDSYEYKFADGSSVQYWLDEDMLPYHMVHGERVYMLLPLPHLQLTDPVLLEQIQETLPDNPELIDFESNISAYSEPTDYYHLKLIEGKAVSVTYSEKVYFDDEALKYTPIFKYDSGMNGIIFHTSTSKRINFVYSSYDIYRDKWETFKFESAIDCSKNKGAFQHFPALYPYGQFSFNQYDTISDMTYDVHTVNAW